MAFARLGGLPVAVSWGFAPWRLGCACTLWVLGGCVEAWEWQDPREVLEWAYGTAAGTGGSRDGRGR